MKVGIFVFQTGAAADPAVLARRAEELGFDSYWVPEHPIIPVHTTSAFPGSGDGTIPRYYSQALDPFLALARASATTSTIRLGTGVCLVPERNPLLLAKEVATLDQQSGGRFLFGIGAGWLKEETEIMGADYTHRWSQTRDAVLAMKELWTKEESEYHGEYYDFPPVRSFPKPARSPHPPIILGGQNNPRVFRRIVQWGDGWLPTHTSPEEIRQGRQTLNDMAAETVRDPESIEIIAFGTPDQFRDRKVLKELEDAGADGATIWLRRPWGDEALAEMEDNARLVL